MSISNEVAAMRLALEALQFMDSNYISLPQQGMQAIKALEESLAQSHSDVKQEQEYPFGVYSAEDLNNAWKSGYDNCKAQAVWTLEDVKNAWKRGYASAKKECRAKEAKEKP